MRKWLAPLALAVAGCAAAPASAAPSGGVSDASYAPVVAPAASTSGAPVAAASSAPASASSAPSVASSAPLPSPSELPRPPALEGWFSASRAVNYRVRDEVDTHDPSAKGPAVTKGRATVRVAVESTSGGWVASATWAMPDGVSWYAPPDTWTLRGGVLTIAGDDGWTFREDELQKAKRPICREDTGQGMYGPTSRRLCVDSRGLVSLRETNRNGPRVLEITRE